MSGLEIGLAFWLVLQPDTAAKPAKPTAEKDAPAVSPTPIPTPNDLMTYTYNPFGKRDPFRSYLSEKAGKNRESKDPLLNYDLSKFTLTGVLWGISNPKAIVVDGDGHGHVISRGTRMGRNKGQVVRILKDEVVVSEEYRDPLGKLLVSEHALKLSRKEELQ
jgi:type IV pilus assembly protein PilP